MIASFIVRFILPVAAVVGVGLAVYTVSAQSREVKPAPPVAQPAPAPFSSNVPGAGLVEPSTENIAIGTHVPGVVTKVFVKAGDRVKAGEPLFQIDERSLRAELAQRESQRAVWRASVARLKAEPRPETIPPVEARVAEMRKMLEDAEAQLAMYENVQDKRAINNDELSRRRFATKAAEARLSQALADLALIKLGAWGPDVAVAEANLATATADVERVKTELDRLTVKSPVDADVLKVNIRAGEYAQSSAPGSGPGVNTDALMILGETQTLHIRVDIDENDAWRVNKGAPGVAYVRGNSNLKTTIEFVRFEPYVIPKRSLTGSSAERVDTRVLQVIYAFKRSELPVFVGQQMDVFLESKPIGDAKFGVDAARAAMDLEAGSAKGNSK
jgi:HlyD family secretion protein